MNSAYDGEMLKTKLNSSDISNNTWVLTQEKLNCTEYEECFEKLNAGIEEFTGSAFMWLVLSNIFPLFQSFLLFCCLYFAGKL